MCNQNESVFFPEDQPIPAQMPQQPYTPYPAYQPQPPREWLLKSHDALSAWASILVGFLFVRYVICYADGLLTTCFFLLLYTGISLYLRKSGYQPMKSHQLLGGILCLFSLVFTLSASPVLHGLCAIFLLVGNVWRVQAIYGDIPFVSRYLLCDIPAAITDVPFRHYGAAPAAISNSIKQSKSASAIKTILVALLVTIPLTALVGGLLSAADSGIEQLMQKLLRTPPESLIKLLVQLACGIPVGWWFFATVYGKLDSDDNAREEAFSHARIIPNLGLYAGVTPICLLYLVYVISQTSYFLSAFAGKLPADMIYSEYARRGFFELCAIAVINLFVLLILNGCAKNGGSNRPKALTFYACILCGFTLFIIATAIAKMLLYINAYGLTPLRLYTAWFMVLLAIVFVVLMLRMFHERLKTSAVLTLSFLVMFGLLCFSRPDACIASYNIHRYEQGTLSELDVDMLLGLSEDAYVVMANHTDALEQAGAFGKFQNKMDAQRETYQKHPDQSWNLSAWLLSKFN